MAPPLAKPQHVILCAPVHHSGETPVMKLIVFYVVFVLIGMLGAYAIGRTVEHWSETASLPVFLGSFFLVFWLAWMLAVRLTKPHSV